MNTLTWNDAVEQAFEPTEWDHTLSGGLFGMGKPRIGENGKIQDINLIRERAAMAYIKAHEGEMVRVTYCDPKQVNEQARQVWAAVGELKNQFVTYPVFDELSLLRGQGGFVLGSSVIPFAGLSSMETDSDRPTVVL